MKRRLVVIGLLVCLLSTGAWAITWQSYVGNWNDPNGWVDKRLPTGAEEVQIIGPNSVCTLNTSTGSWGDTQTQRLRVYSGAILNVEQGAELLGAGWMRVGAGSAGVLNQTGGLVKLSKGKDSSRLGIGDSAGSDGVYTISGGTLTYGTTPDGSILVGARGGKGKFVVVGTEPNIVMDQLAIPNQAGASGTLEFQTDANGVSPVVIKTSVKLDELGDEQTAALVVSTMDAPPIADIVLVDFQSDTATVAGVFDTVNGKPAPEGAEVTISAKGRTCTYALTYVGGTGNDIVLVFKSAATRPTIVYVTDSPDINGDGVMDDVSVIDWLTAEGYTVDTRRGYWQTLDVNKIAELNAADLVIASCGLSTGNYSGGDKPTQWNSLTSPMINFNPWLLRTSRWKWMNSNTAVKDAGAPLLKPVDPNHPVFAGVELDPNGVVAVLDASIDNGQTSFLQDIVDVGNGTLLATSVGKYTSAFIAEWKTGVEYYAGAGQFAGGPRLMFMATEQETGAPSQQGAFNLNAAGQQILRNMITYLAPDKPDVGGQ
jgi:hypothetical protein